MNLLKTSLVFTTLTLTLNTTAYADQVVADDQIVQFSQCIGNDCVNGENFGFDTLRLKENNTRIRFTDTSVSASFPTNDWQLTANDTNNGGLNYFSIDDASANRSLFKIEAGARSNSLYIDSNSYIGLGTASPLMDLHISGDDSPAIRLEQNTNTGFAAASWDIAANESSFFVRDVNNSSNLPFSIQAAAPSDSLVVKANGEVHSEGRICSNNGGVESCIGSVPSSITLKTIIEQVDTKQILEAVSGLSMPKWYYNSNGADVTHIGPIAEEFQQAFGLNGGVDKSIANVDLSGVALASIQELNKQLKAKDNEIAQLKNEIAQIKQMLLNNAGE